MAYDAVNLRSVVVGGTIQGVHTSEMWRYNGTWLQITTSYRPSAREGSAMVYDSLRQREILFSGYSGLSGPGIVGGYENATWELSSFGWTVPSLTGPSPRAGHVMVYQTSPTNRTLLFGGSNRPNVQSPANRLGDTWEWNASTSTWTQLNVAGPEARDFAAMAYDTSRRVGVLFGGLSDILGVAGDTWEWSSIDRAWVRVDIPGPPARYDASMVYDPTRGVCVLFGGATGLSVGDTWQYAGPSAGGSGGWSKLLTSVNPAQRFGQGMTYDAFRGHVVMFGGQAGFTYLGDTWEADFGGWPVVTSRPMPTTMPTGCTAVFSVAGASPPLNHSLSYLWRLNGAPLTDDGRISGSSTGTLTIADASAADAGSYDAILTTDCGSVQSTAAALSLIDPVSITDQPHGVIACPGGSAAFTLAITGGIAPVLQWQWQPDLSDPAVYPIDEGDTVDPLTGMVAFSASGSQASTLTVNSVALARPAVFFCGVSDGCTTLASDPATLTLCRADFDCSGSLAVADIFAFLDAWFAGSTTADFDGVSGLQIADIFAFLDAWFAGC
jgi:hypothetical protein